MLSASTSGLRLLNALLRGAASRRQARAFLPYAAATVHASAPSSATRCVHRACTCSISPCLLALFPRRSRSSPPPAARRTVTPHTLDHENRPATCHSGLEGAAARGCRGRRRLVPLLGVALARHLTQQLPASSQARRRLPLGRAPAGSVAARCAWRKRLPTQASPPAEPARRWCLPAESASTARCAWCPRRW